MHFVELIDRAFKGTPRIEIAWLSLFDQIGVYGVRLLSCWVQQDPCVDLEACNYLRSSFELCAFIEMQLGTFMAYISC